MGDNMKLNYVELKNSCSQLHSQTANINNILEEIKNLMDSVENNHDWVGPAADFYQEKTTKLTSKFDQIYEELEVAIRYVEQVADKYDNLEKQIIGNLPI